MWYTLCTTKKVDIIGLFSKKYLSTMCTFLKNCIDKELKFSDFRFLSDNSK